MSDDRPRAAASRPRPFTGRARTMLTSAESDARRRGGPIGSLQILLALARPNDGPAARALATLGVDDSAIGSAMRAIGPLPDRRGTGVGFDEDAQRIIQLAAEESRTLGSDAVDSAHFLIGVARAGGTGRALLAHLGVDASAARVAVRHALEG